MYNILKYMYNIHIWYDTVLFVGNYLWILLSGFPRETEQNPLWVESSGFSVLTLPAVAQHVSRHFTRPDQPKKAGVGTQKPQRYNINSRFCWCCRKQDEVWHFWMNSLRFPVLIWVAWQKLQRSGEVQLSSNQHTWKQSDPKSIQNLTLGLFMTFSAT